MMAHLPEDIVAQRRAQLQEEILEGWQEAKGEPMYVVVCPCELPPLLPHAGGQIPEAEGQ